LKKLAAILLLIVQLYDLGGYHAVRQYLVYYSDRYFNEQTAKGMYNKQDLVEVEIPVNLPGITNWNAYIPVCGQIKFGDNAYNYVQMRMTSHTLFLKCIPNYETTQLNTQNIINATPIKNMPVPKKQHVPYASGIFMDGFGLNFVNSVFNSSAAVLPQYTAVYLQPVIGCYIDIPKQPPKLPC